MGITSESSFGVTQMSFSDLLLKYPCEIKRDEDYVYACILSEKKHRLNNRLNYYRNFGYRYVFVNGDLEIDLKSYKAEEYNDMLVRMNELANTARKMGSKVEFSNEAIPNDAGDWKGGNDTFTISPEDLMY
jgi:hypothetical protein